jgi:hypothetical protein
VAAQVQLNSLSDHDLLVQIATRCECLPDLQKRMDEAEREIARLKAEGRVITAVGSIVAMVIGVFVQKP